MTTARLRAVRRLTLGYDQRVVARDLGVEIPDGSFTVIVGPNACGKSTLLKALARMLKPQAGTVYLDGAAIASLAVEGGGHAARHAARSRRSCRAASRSATWSPAGRYAHQRLLRQWSREDEAAVDARRCA